MGAWVISSTFELALKSPIRCSASRSQRRELSSSESTLNGFPGQERGAFTDSCEVVAKMAGLQSSFAYVLVVMMMTLQDASPIIFMVRT